MKKGTEPLNVDTNKLIQIPFPQSTLGGSKLCMQLASFRLHSCTTLSSFPKKVNEKMTKFGDG